MHSIASRVTYWNTENNRRIKGIDEGALNGRPYLFAVNRQNIYNYRRRYRGVAQLVAYVLWEHGVAGSNPVTSTRKKRIPICSSCEQVLGTKCLRNLSEQMGILFALWLKFEEGDLLFCHFIDSGDISQGIFNGRTSFDSVLDKLAFLCKASLAHSAGAE